MRIAIYGVGGIGGFFGGRLAQAGETVIFIARGATLAALRAHGLRVQSGLGDFTIDPVQVTDDPASVGPVDAVIVAVKTWQVPEIAPHIRPLLGPETAVLPFCNGVEAADQLAAALGSEPVLDGTARIFSAIVEPGVIQHTGWNPTLQIGERDNRRSARVEQLAQVLTQAGAQVEIPPDITVASWAKFVFITAFSGVASVTRSPAGAIRALPPTRTMLLDAMHEIHAVAQARGVALPTSAVDGAMAMIDAMPEAGTPSMQRDILAGRPSELEAQNGAVVRLGQAAGVPAPVNGFLYASLLPQEMRAREK